MAQVPDIKTQSFLSANFKTFREAWIGVWYFCSFSKAGLGVMAVSNHAGPLKCVEVNGTQPKFGAALQTFL